jgi:hypothetical protein
MLKKMVNCWRYGQLSPRFVYFFRMGVILLVFIPVWLFWNNEQLTQDKLVLVDVLLGLPLGLALWLTMVIIWQGVIKTIACFWGGMTINIPEASVEEIELTGNDVVSIDTAEGETKKSKPTQKET